MGGGGGIMLWPVNVGVSPSFFLASLAGKKVLLIQLGITPPIAW